MAMTPANDAFTLNNRYSYTHHSRRSPRASTRSPSPTTMAFGKLTRRTSRRLSHGNSSVTLLEGIGEDASREVEVREDDTHPRRSPEVKKKINWEVPRKLFHSSIGFFVIPLYVHGITARPTTIVLSGALALIGATDVIRLHNTAFEKLYERFLGFLMRDSERRKVNGVIWYLIGVLISLNVYPLDVAVVSILILSWADTAASTFGRLWGPYTPALPSRIPLIPLLPAAIQPYLSLPLAKRKSLAGFIAASLTAGLVVFGFWGWIAPMQSIDAVWTWNHRILGGWAGLGILSIFSALIGGVAEALDLGSLDDNLTIPVISGGVIWGALRAVSAFL